jgi:hypothetical protein
MVWFVPGGKKETLTMMPDAPSAMVEDEELQRMAGDTATDSSQDDNEKGAESSAAQDAKQEEPSLLEAAQAALERDEADGNSSSQEQGQEHGSPRGPEESQPEGTAPNDKDGKVREGQDDRFDRHPRFQELKRQRDGFRTEAEEYRKISGYMQEHGLTPDEVAQGFVIMGMMKSNPAQARELLGRHMRTLDQFAGEVLPEDLQTRVNGGGLDRESARELALMRNQKAFAQQQQLELAEREAGVSKGRVVTAWERNIQTRDPDYAAKQKLVADRAQVLMREWNPQTPQEALAVVQQAYDEVSEHLKAFLPRRAPARSTSSSASSMNARPEPTSLLEAARQALEG